MTSLKPRLFIGSSIEGLNIAYAAQQNLQHTAEITVWDQGVFNLSVSALDSLLSMLNTCDFGMFVFSPDDIINIRGSENQAIRDNVIFELGLFVGKLGKERCFILIPDKNNEIRIPTDLIGMTPATYETTRSDNSTQAATGPACHMIRNEITSKGRITHLNQSATISLETKDNSLGNLVEKEIEKEIEKEREVPGVDQSSKVIERDNGWLDAYIDNNFDYCIELLDIKISTETVEDEIVDLESWKGRALFSKDNEVGVSYLKGIIQKYPTYSNPYIHLVYGLKEIYEHDMCLQVADDGIRAVSEPIDLIKAKCSCLDELGLNSLFEEELKNAILAYPKFPELAIMLSNHYKDNKNNSNAKRVLEVSLKINPIHKDLSRKYASLLYDQNEMKQALTLYNKLIYLEPDNSEYLTMRANIYLQLELNDLAMIDYKKANDIAENKQGWILGNIGNLYNSRGFYHEAISYLRKAIELNPDSEYAHNRLSEAIKKKDEEKKKLEIIIKEAQRAIACTNQNKKIQEAATLEPRLPQLTITQ